MSKGETARKCYEGTRLEIIWRIKLRDQVLIIYLGAVGALLSVSFGTNAKQELLLAISFIAMGASALIAQHNSAIGSLVYFCTHEINDFLAKLDPPEDSPQWDNSKTLKLFSNKSLLMRSWGHCIVIISPCVVSLQINWIHAINSPFPFGQLWWFSCLCTCLSIWILFDTNNFRKEIYKRYNWPEY